MESQNNIIEKLPSRTAFWAGVVVSGGIIFALGFVVLVILIIKGVEIQANSETESAPTTVQPLTNNNQKVVPDNPTTAAATGSLDLASLSNVRGDGNITVVEYSDTECPFCKRFHSTMQQVIDEYDGQVQWAYKHFPLESLHSKAKREAMATECAAEQGKFWEYTDLLFETTPSNNGLADDKLFTMAETVGVEAAQFNDCLESEKYAAKVESEIIEAQKLGGTGTPFSVIVDENGTVLGAVPGALPFESIAPTLDQYIK